MMQDLEAGGYAEGTRKAYVDAARDFVAFHWCPAEQMGQAHVRQFLGYLRNVWPLSAGRMKQYLAGLKFLYGKTLGRPDAAGAGTLETAGRAGGHNGVDQVPRYLGRYTHRVAIANSRLAAITDSAVTFRTKSGKTCTLAPSNSSDDSCFTYCQRASSRFGTTVYWPL
jgi:hypothetical protein